MMKRMLVVLAMVPMLARATDLSVGTIEITGNSNVGFDSSSSKFKGATESADTTTMNLNVTGLYYVIPNLGVGLTLGYNNTETTFAGNKDGLSTFIIGPAVGYDIPVAEKLAVALQGSLGYASSTSSSTGSPDTTFSGYAFGLGAGLKYFVVKSFSIDGGIGYNYVKLSGDNVGGITPELTTSGFGVNVGLSVYFGG